MSRYKEAVEKRLAKPGREPGLLDVHFAMLPLFLSALTQIKVRIPKAFEVSQMRSFRSDFGDIPSIDEEQEDYIFVVPDGCRAAVKIDGEEHLFDATKKHPSSKPRGRAAVGGTIQVDVRGNYFMRGGKRFQLSRRLSQLAHKGKKMVTATYEPHA